MANSKKTVAVDENVNTALDPETMAMLGITGDNTSVDGIDGTDKVSTDTTSVDTVTTEIKEINDSAEQAMLAKAIAKAMTGMSDAETAKADRTYAINIRSNMIKKMRSDKVETIVGDEIYEPILGKAYTFLYNTIPVTIKFDGTEQEFPSFIAKKIREKLAAISKSNRRKIVNEKISSVEE